MPQNSREKTVAACLAIFALLTQLLTQPAIAQTPAPKFEIAGVNAAPYRPYQSLGPVLYSNGRYEFRDASLLSLITTAYGLDPDRVIGGPPWFESARFDVSAKATPDATQESLNAMLRALLADRFKLTFHTGTSPMAGYALRAGNSSKLTKSSGKDPAGCRSPMVAGGRGAAARFTDITGTPVELGPGGAIFYECRNITMAAFVELLRKMSPQDFGNNPLVDETGLKDVWDFDLKYSVMRGPADSDLPTIFVGISQVGLKLEATKAPAPVTIVDSASQPTSNPPNLDELLPVRATAFESVELTPVSVRPMPNGGVQGQSQGGRVNLRLSNVRAMIASAWGIAPQQVSGGPAFVDTLYPELVAHAPVTTTTGLRQVIDNDTLQLMLRNMLADKFKLIVHEEQQPTDVFVLTADKPKLVKADPASRTGCVQTDANGLILRSFGMDTARHISCRNMTMEQFTAQLPQVAANMFAGKSRTVVDATKLSGTWDFNFVFTGFGAPPVQQLAGPPQPSLIDVLDQTFGLKLELQKVPQKSIVIDRIEEPAK